MSVFLSANDTFDSDLDFLLGDLVQFQDIGADNRFVYLAELPINDVSLIPGDYFLILIVDSKDVELGNVDGVVDEVDETNNIFVSDAPSIAIVKLADLTPSNLSHDPGSFLIGEVFQLNFDVANEGLADITGDEVFTFQVVLTDDREVGNPDDSVLVEFDETEGLPVGQTRSYQVNLEIPEGTRIGSFHSLAVFADSAEIIAESDEENNVAIADNEDVFVQKVTIDEAVDQPGLLEFQTSPLVPWFGQSDFTFDGEDAAQSGGVGDNSISSFSTTINFLSPSVVSFYWKVSSERTQTPSGGVKEDFLSFKIDGTEQARVSGEVDFQLRSFPVAAGTHVVEWSYQKDDTNDSGDDTAYVDQLVYLVPDFDIIDFQVFDVSDTNITEVPTALVSGDTIRYELTIENIGSLPITGTPPYDLRVIISRNQTFDDDDDFTLNTLTEVAEIAVEDDLGTVGVIENQLFIDRTVQIPNNIDVDASFFIGFKIDSGEAIAESDEDNNLVFSANPFLDVSPIVTLEEALDLGAPATLGEIVVTGGDGTWFGQVDESFDTVDAAQASPIEFNQEVFMEREVTGPVNLTFYWKVSSLFNFNFLRFFLNEAEVLRISGEVDWKEETIFIPAGTQKVRWSYSKFSSAVVGDDTGWVDNILIEPVVLPDLVISSFETVPGEYILDLDKQFTETADGDKLPIEVVVVNQGADLDVGVTFDTSDLEVRFSTDLIWGNSDDILLGEFARVETFPSGFRVIFSGPLNLSLEIPANSYHLAVRVDPLEDILEADEDNNVVFTDQRDITVVRLPDLLVGAFVFDNSKIFYPEGRIVLDYDIINRGLGDIEGSQTFTSSITARAITQDDLDTAAGDPEQVLANSQEIVVFGNFTHQAFLPGRSAPDRLNGSSLSFHAELTLPTEQQILDVIGVDEPLDSRVYFVTITVDADGNVNESGERNLILIFGLTFVIVPSPVAQTEAAWQADYELIFGAFAGGDDDQDDDLIVDLLEYAFNLNPFVANGVGTDIFNNFGFILDNNDLYLNVTFDIVKAATDLTYDVEVADDPGGPWVSILTISPPFLLDTGPTSLTGPGGLEASDAKILAVSDQGYTARITVRDEDKVDDIVLGMRFLRINVNGVTP